MKKSGLFQTLGIVALFLVAASAYFAPQLEGKLMGMHDVEQYQNSVADAVSHMQTTGEDPQWSGATFSGMPSYSTSLSMPSRLVWQATRYVYALLGHPITIIFFAMLCFWIMLLLWGKIDKLAAVIPALAYGFSTYTILIIGAGHVSKGYAIAYAPLLIGAVIYTYQSRKIWTGAALAALGGTLLITAGHPQITYYFILVLAALVVWKLVGAIRDKWFVQFAKATGALAVAAVVAVGANFINLYYTNEAAKGSTRGGSELLQESGERSSGLDYEYAVAWSYGRTESVNVFIPDLMGGASDKGFAADGAVAEELRQYGMQQYATQFPAYWGDKPYTAGPTYIGALLIFLALLALFTVKGSLKWWLLGITGFGFLLAWGGNAEWFTKFFRSVLPGYEKFRSLDTGLVIAQWTIPMLAAIGIAASIGNRGQGSGVRKNIFWAAGIAGGVALLFILFGGAMFSFSAASDEGIRGSFFNLFQQNGIDNSAMRADRIVAAMHSERASIMRMDALRSLLFVLLGAGVMLTFAYGKMKRAAMFVTLAGLVVIDLVWVDIRYVSYDKFEEPKAIRPTQADIAIMQDKALGYRVADLAHSTFNDASAARYHRSIGGYSAAKLQRYQDVIDRYLNRRHMGVYDMLNVRYIITPEGVQDNPNANGAAWFVERVILVGSLAEEVAALDTLDTKRFAVANKVSGVGCQVSGVGCQVSGVGCQVSGVGCQVSGNKIDLVEYAPNRLTYKYSAESEAVAVFSEIYYPRGWTATIDGKPADYFCADYILRAMELPAGEHTIVWTFRAPNYAIVSQVTLWFSIILFVWLAIIIVKGLKKS